MTHRISIGAAFKDGWDTFAKRPLFFIGVLLLLFVAALLVQIPSTVIGLLTPQDVENADAALLGMLLIGTWGSLLFSLGAWAVQQYLSTGIINLTLEAASGRPYTLRSLFVQPVPFLNALLASIIVGVLVVIGLLFLIIPGIYLSLAFSPVIYVALDKKLGAVDAVQHCWQLTKGNRGMLFLFGMAGFGINLLGMLALGIGLLVTIPFTWLAMAHVYRQLADKKA